MLYFQGYAPRIGDFKMQLKRSLSSEIELALFHLAELLIAFEELDSKSIVTRP